jgi:precorrin-6A synthase
MKTILVIGIGAGDPDHITVQAVKALNRTDVFFLLDKGPAKADLIELRKEICRRHLKGDHHRFVDAESPAWDKRTPTYGPTVDALNADKQALFERLIEGEMAEGECGAFLVWGDPALYDSTIRILDAIVARGAVEIDYEVIPGISSVQALAARHRIPLNRIGGPVEITTGRRLAQGFPEHADSVVVMLDANDTYRQVAAEGLDIWWGAYVGTPDEILISGRLEDVAEEIAHVRAEARAAKGWIMDSYLLRRREAGD